MSTAMKNPGKRHVLGFLRWPLVGVMSVAGVIMMTKLYPFSSSLESTYKLVRITTYFSISFVVAFILTTEAFIRLLVALFIGAAITAAVSGVSYLLFKAFGWNLGLIVWIAGLTGLVSVIWTFMQLWTSSSWIGSYDCPYCPARGSVSSREIDKRHMGSKIKHEGSSYKTYNKYWVKRHNICSSCGNTWESTGDREEQA